MAGRKPTVSDQEILEVFEDTDDPVLTASEIASELSIGDRGVFKRLQELEEKEFIKSKIAGNTRVWWLSELYLGDEMDLNDTRDVSN